MLNLHFFLIIFAKEITIWQFVKRHVVGHHFYKLGCSRMID